MKVIRPHKVNIKNFRSFINESYTFPTTTGLKLLTGENLVEPALGANGCGKSSLWEAICWCLFGYGVKGSKTAALVTWEEKHTEVALELFINDVKYIIHRCGPPMKSFINGNNATQQDIDQLVGLTYDRFLHSIIFGQGEKLFPDLSMPDRANLFDQVLDLSIWMKCIETASQKCITFEKQITEKRNKASYIQGQLSSLPTDEELLKDIQKWEDEHNEYLERVKLCIKDLTKKKDKWKDQLVKQGEEKARQVDELEKQLAPLADDMLDETTGLADQLQETQKLLKEYEGKNNAVIKQYYGIETDIKHLDVSKEFWNSDTCPQCKQKITEHTKQEELAHIGSEKSRLTTLLSAARVNSDLYKEQIELAKQTITKLTREEATHQEKKKAAEREYHRIDGIIKQLCQEGESIVNQIDSEQDPYTTQITNLQIELSNTQENPYIEKAVKAKDNRNYFEKELTTIQQEYKQIEANLVAAEYWKHGFKRIRLFFVEQVLLALQIEIKAAISALGLDGWSIQLSTEQETKSGNTKLGIGIKVKSLQAEGAWEGWSGGESQRLRLAIAMGLASLIQRSAGVSWSLEVFDEPTQFLSSEGIEDLLQALQYRAESHQKQVWITDHRALQFSGFQEIWGVIKDHYGSKILKISESD